MRAPPKLAEFYRYPVITGTALIAIAVSVAWWTKLLDVSPIVESAMIRRGEVWRLVTSIFPHVNFIHLFFNIYWLWVFGTVIEEVYGHLKTAALMLLFAVGPNALEFAFSIGGVGLSGIGYGLFGLLWILSKRDERFRDAVDSKTIQLFVGWFFLCIFLGWVGIMSVGNIAHGAGALFGILTAYAITLPENRAPISFGISAVLVFALWAATLGRPTVNLSGKAGFEEAQWGYEASRANRNQQAVRWFRDAVKYQPKNPEFWYDLAVTWQRAGDLPAAAGAYRKAAELNYPDAEYYLGNMYETGTGGLAKDEKKAVQWYRKAADQGFAEAQNSVAWAYATSSDLEIRNPEAALEYALKANNSSPKRPNFNPNYLDTLAEAYYVNGRYEEAVKTEKRAIALVSNQQTNDFQRRLAKYELASNGNQPRVKGK